MAHRAALIQKAAVHDIPELASPRDLLLKELFLRQKFTELTMLSSVIFGVGIFLGAQPEGAFKVASLLRDEVKEFMFGEKFDYSKIKNTLLQRKAALEDIDNIFKEVNKL